MIQSGPKLRTQDQIDPDLVPARSSSLGKTSSHRAKHITVIAAIGLSFSRRIHSTLRKANRPSQPLKECYQMTADSIPRSSENSPYGTEIESGESLERFTNQLDPVSDDDDEQLTTTSEIERHSKQPATPPGDFRVEWTPKVYDDCNSMVDSLEWHRSPSPELELENNPGVTHLLNRISNCSKLNVSLERPVIEVATHDEPLGVLLTPPIGTTSFEVQLTVCGLLRRNAASSYELYNFFIDNGFFASLSKVPSYDCWKLAYQQAKEADNPFLIEGLRAGQDNELEFLRDIFESWVQEWHEWRVARPLPDCLRIGYKHGMTSALANSVPK